MRLWPIVTCLLIAGCSHSSQSLLEVNRKQAATIDALNLELTRLNKELSALHQNKGELLSSKRELERKFQAEMGKGDMNVALEGRGLVITVSERILFDSGRADLKPESLTVLGQVADVLIEKVSDNRLYIDGHTDNVPIIRTHWRSNWELSVARSLEVLHYFIEDRGFPPEKIAASGYGEYVPISDNATSQGRMQNRRVEIVLAPAGSALSGLKS